MVHCATSLALQDLHKGRKKQKKRQRKQAKPMDRTMLLLPLPQHARWWCSRMGGSCLPTPRAKAGTAPAPNIMRPFDRSNPPGAPPSGTTTTLLCSCDRSHGTSSLRSLVVDRRSQKAARMQEHGTKRSQLASASFHLPALPMPAATSGSSVLLKAKLHHLLQQRCADTIIRGHRCFCSCRAADIVGDSLKKHTTWRMSNSKPSNTRCGSERDVATCMDHHLYGVSAI